MTAGNSGRVGAGLGTFAGVFTPSVLTILGIVLFLRLGYVVGNVGLLEALLILTAAHVVSIVTSLSVAAIATNLRVKGGGDYYLISRTLGLGFGGAIGLVLFLAQAVAIGFYCIGFAEALARILELDGLWAGRVIGALAVTGLFGLAWAGADVATRFQYLVMALLVTALTSFVLGAMPVWDGAVLRDNLAAPPAPLPPAHSTACRCCENARNSDDVGDGLSSSCAAGAAAGAAVAEPPLLIVRLSDDRTAEVRSLCRVCAAPVSECVRWSVGAWLIAANACARGRLSVWLQGEAADWPWAD